MSNQKVFCSVPWTNTHLYWNGTYGACCYELHPPAGDQYNLKYHSLDEWRDSQSMQDFRNRLLGDQPLSECMLCYKEEKYGHESRRIKENYKVAIFTEQAFDKSFAVSPWVDIFKSGTNVDPPDWHIDFGNECNLACKMCNPKASSKIASLYKKWNIEFDLQDNWINDNDKWNQFLKNVDNSKKLHRIHVMGGEPTINKKFLSFVEKLIQNNRTDISLSFVTNGTKINKQLIEHLTKFSKVDIEVSIESLAKNNEYIRQGSDTQEIIKNILWYKQNTNFQIVLRSVPQLFSINTYHDYILWAFDQNLSIQSNPLIYPEYLQISLLPAELKAKFISNFEKVKNYIITKSGKQFNTTSTGRDVSRLALQLSRECNVMIEQLSCEQPDNYQDLITDLICWCVRWDREYKLDATKIFPEYKDFLTKNGYSI